MYFIIYMFMLIMLISMIMLKVSMMVAKKKKINLEKMSPFECGFNPMKFNRMPFSIRFFLITVIFLIFDIEIALIIPMVLSMKISYLKLWMISSIMFTLILILGLMYEWKNGILNWI